MKRRLTRLVARLKLSLRRLLSLIGLFLILLVASILTALDQAPWTMGWINFIQITFGASGWVATAVVIGGLPLFFTVLVAFGMYLRDRGNAEKKRAR